MSTYQDALDEVARQVRVIGTRGMLSDPVSVRYLDWEDVVKVGGVTVRYTDDYRENQEGTNVRDIYGYPCHVLISQTFRLQIADDVLTAFDVKQNVRSYFHNKRRMSGACSEGMSELPCVVTDGPRAPQRFADKLFLSLTVWCWFLQPRDAASYVP